MNFKSRILKLSILFMLVLVLIPAIAAEESSEAFFIEFEEESIDEVVVEESDSITEIEEAQKEVSVYSEVEEDIEENYRDIPIQDQSFEIEENHDTIIDSEQIDCSVVETHFVIEQINNEDETSEELYYENISNNINFDNDFNENADELTIKNISVIYQGSIFISKFYNDDNNLILIKDLFTGTTNNETEDFKRSLHKVLELKNDLLINQKIQFILADNIHDIDDDVIICADKLTTDYVFSIDNSVIGDENLIIFVTASFCLKFNPCFDAFICCDFFDVEYFCGDFCDCCFFSGNFFLYENFPGILLLNILKNFYVIRDLL